MGSTFRYLMNRKSILSIIIILTFILNILSVLKVQADMPYEDVTTNIIFTVSYSMDDAYDLIGYQFRNNTTLAYLKSSSYDTYTGIIFNSTTIPVGATINHAYLSLYGSDAVDSNSYLTTVYGIDDDDCGTFAVEADLTGITQTSAFANWDLSSLEGGAWANSTDLKAVVQEIINRGGWASGNALGFRLSSAKSAYGYRSFRTYDYTGSTYDPKIYITYTVSTVISQANPWDYISDFNDNWILLNETNGYTWWEVWNTSSMAGLMGAKGSPIEFFRYADTLPNEVQANWGISADEYTMLAWKGVIYATGYNETAGYLYRSFDGGDTWVVDNLCVIPNNLIAMTIDNITETLHFCYISYTSPHLYTKTFGIANQSISTPVDCGGYGTMSVVSVKWYKNNLYMVFTNGNQIWEQIRTGWSWGFGVDISNSANFPAFAPSITYIIDNDEVHTFAVWCRNSLYGDLKSRLVEPDLSLNTINDMVEYSKPYSGLRTIQDANKNVRLIFVVSFTFNPSITIDDLVTKEWTFGTVGSWSATNILASGGYIGYDIDYDTVWSSGEYTIVYNIHSGTPKRVQIITGDSVWINQNTYDFSYDNPERLSLISSGGGEGEHQFILLDPEGNPDDDIPDYIDYQPDYLNSTYDKFLFEGEVYRIDMSVNNTDITYLTLNDTVHTLIFSYNNNTDVYKLEVADADGTLVNQLVAGLISSGKTDYNGNITSIWWKFILNTNIVDCVDRDFSYILQYTNSSSPYNILLTETGLIDANITIYNLGGVIEYTFTGDGGHTIGGHPFQIYATNSTLSSTARANIIYRRLQGIHVLVELNMDNKNDGYRLEELSNIGYFEMGIDYKLEGNETGAWIEGWMCRVYVDDINVGTNFDGLLLKDRAYINTRVLWFNRGNLIRGDEKVFSYHWAYDRDLFPSQRNTITFWVDLWFDKANASTVFGGRMNPQYYGYTEVGSAWWFNSAFRPLTNNITSSMLFDDVTDSNGNIVSSKQISLVKVHCKVAKIASAGDADRWEVEPFQIMKMQLAKERMEGIDTPDFIETQQLNIAGYGMYNILGGVGTIISGALLGVIRLMMGSMDTFLSYFGLPYGTFSTLMNYISISFSSLMGWLASATAVFSSMLSIFSSLVTNISSFITYTIATILFFLSDIFTIPLQLIQLIIAVLNGTTITFYGIPFDFTPYKDLMDALKQIMPTFGSMMFATWLVYGNVSFEGEPTIEGIMGRIKLSFEWIRDTYSGIFWIFNSIYSEILFIYAWVKSHIPTLGGTPAQAPQA